MSNSICLIWPHLMSNSTGLISHQTVLASFHIKQYLPHLASLTSKSTGLIWPHLTSNSISLFHSSHGISPLLNLCLLILCLFPLLLRPLSTTPHGLFPLPPMASFHSSHGLFPLPAHSLFPLTSHGLFPLPSHSLFPLPHLASNSICLIWQEEQKEAARGVVRGYGLSQLRSGQRPWPKFWLISASFHSSCGLFPLLLWPHKIKASNWSEWWEAARGSQKKGQYCLKSNEAKWDRYCLLSNKAKRGRYCLTSNEANTVWHQWDRMRQILFDIKWGQMRQILFEAKWCSGNR